MQRVISTLASVRPSIIVNFVPKSGIYTNYKNKNLTDGCYVAVSNITTSFQASISGNNLHALSSILNDNRGGEEDLNSLAKELQAQQSK